MKAETQTRASDINGINLEALGKLVAEIKNDPAKGFARFKVASSWTGQTQSETHIQSYFMNGEEIYRGFAVKSDEPKELLGQNSAPNPQELLMAAFNACITVGYVATASVMGVELEAVEIQTEGELDLRGFLGLDANVKPGYDSIAYTVRMKGKGSADQFRAIHENVLKTSPNYFNISKPVTVNARLVIG